MKRWLTTSSTTERVRLGVQALLALVAVSCCALPLQKFFALALGRVDEPYALWWVEPILQRAALAARQGLPLYGPPSLVYTPPVYNPGLALVGAGLFSIFDPGLPVLRAFGLGSFVALAVVLGVWTGRLTRNATIGFVAFAWMLACVGPVGSTPIFVNVDGPATLCCVLAGALVIGEPPPTRARTIAAALCVVLAFLFKQPGCLIAVPLAFYLYTRDRSMALTFVAVSGGVATLVVGGLLLASHGWYWTYAFDIPLHTRRVDKGALLLKLARRHWAEAAGLAIAPLLLTLLGPQRLRGSWLGLSAAFAAIGYVGITKDGGATNTLLASYAGGVLAFMSLPLLARRLRGARHALAAELLSCAIVVGIGAAATNSGLKAFYKREVRLEGTAPKHQPNVHEVPRFAAFEARLRKRVRRLPQPVFVGGRFFDVGANNTHQTGLLEGSARVPVFDMHAVLEPLQRRPYASMLVWNYKKDREFETMLKRHYRKTKSLGRDPLIGLRVEVWVAQ